MEPVLVQLAIYLTAAVVAVPISQKFGFGSVLGYLVAGMAIGPAIGLVGRETEHIQHYAEFGVVLMLFLIGLEMQPKALWEMRHRLIGLGGLQVGVTLLLIAGLAGVFIGLPWNQAIAAGIILSLSSTAIVMQTLAEKKLERTEGGRSSFAVLLFQDVAAIPLLAIIPLLALGAAPPEDPSHGVALFEGLPPLARAGLVLATAALAVFAGRYLIHPAYRFLTWARLPEIQVAGALLLVVVVSLVMHMLDLSPALGSFLAGVVLANSSYRHQLEADLGPFKGILMGLFFITVGAGMNITHLAEEPLRIIGLVALLLVVKIAVLYPLALLFKLPPDARLLFTLSLAQAGEFGFFLLSFARTNRVLDFAQAETLLLVIALSMMSTPALFWLHSRLSARLGRGAAREADAIDAQGTVIVAGMGRFGQVVNRIVAGLGHRTVVLDNHPDTVDRMRRLGIAAFYGDVDRPDLLEAAGVGEATAVVIAIDDPAKTLRMARYLRRRHPHVHIIARARDRHHVYQLRAAGVEEPVRELYDSAVTAGRVALADLGHDDEEIEEIIDDFVTRDRQMIRELAECWDPSIPIEENAVYLAKAKEQTAIIEAALRSRAERRAAAVRAAADAKAAAAADDKARVAAEDADPVPSRPE